MNLFRRVSTARLVGLIALAVGLAAAAAGIAIAATRGSGPTPPAEPLATAIHDALTAPAPVGVTARIQFTNDLFPSGAIGGASGSSPLVAGASGRLWATAGGFRLELQSDAGDAQIVSDGRTLTVYDASTNTLYKATLPQHAATNGSDTPPTLAAIQSALTKLAGHAEVSGSQPGSIAGEPAYTVRVSPKASGGLLGAAELAWDAGNGVPLRVAIYPRGAGSPALELAVTDISFGPVPSSDVVVAPPPGAKVVDLGALGGGTTSSAKPVTGVQAVSATLPFPLVAPDSLGGLPRGTVRLVELGGKPGALVLYGQGLGATAVLERAADATKAAAPAGLPTVSIGGATATELPTALGTVVRFDRGGVSYTVAASQAPAAVEAAASGLVTP